MLLVGKVPPERKKKNNNNNNIAAKMLSLKKKIPRKIVSFVTWWIPYTLSPAPLPKPLPGESRNRKLLLLAHYWFGTQIPSGNDKPDPTPDPCGTIILRRLLPQFCWGSRSISFGSSQSCLVWSSRAKPFSICESFSGWLLQHLNHSDFWHQSS